MPLLNRNIADTRAVIGQTKKRKFYLIQLMKATSNMTVTLTRIKRLLKMNEFTLRDSSDVEKKFPLSHFD